VARGVVVVDDSSQFFCCCGAGAFVAVVLDPTREKSSQKSKNSILSKQHCPANQRMGNSSSSSAGTSTPESSSSSSSSAGSAGSIVKPQQQQQQQEHDQRFQALDKEISDPHSEVGHNYGKPRPAPIARAGATVNPAQFQTDCQREHMASLTCIEENYHNRTACEPFFTTYKVCRQQENERRKQANANKGGGWF
jgi:hypothetical protein